MVKELKNGLRRRKLRDNFLGFKRKTQSRQAANLSSSLKEGDKNKGRERATPFELDTHVSHAVDKQSQSGKEGFRERVEKPTVPEKLI